MENAFRFVGLVVVVTAAISLYYGCKKTPLDNIMNTKR